MHFEIQQIGTIFSPYKTKAERPIQGSVVPEGKGRIEFFAAYVEGLESIETFSHLILFYIRETENNLLRFFSASSMTTWHQFLTADLSSADR
jgi:tRNA (Thr-GGU) A37 N-methylase